LISKGSHPALKEFWTSGAIGRNSPCAQELSIYWCSSELNATLPWWRSKLASLGNETIGKIISLKIAVVPELSITNESMKIPIICEVITQKYYDG
jgi:hypothetical protein